MLMHSLSHFVALATERHFVRGGDTQMTIGAEDDVFEGSSEYRRREDAAGATSGVPASLRLICELHARLLRSGRGEQKDPGEFRRSQNWIGGTRPGNALFVPPPVSELDACLDAFERFIHETELTRDAKRRSPTRLDRRHAG